MHRCRVHRSQTHLRTPAFFPSPPSSGYLRNDREERKEIGKSALSQRASVSYRDRFCYGTGLRLLGLDPLPHLDGWRYS